MVEPEPAPWVWSRPEDEAIYRNAVRRLRSEDVVLGGYLARHLVTGVNEQQVMAEFHGVRFISELLVSGFREYDDYQAAVEQRDLTARRHERARLLPRRLLLLVLLATLHLQVVFMRRQWEKSLQTALPTQVAPMLRRLIGDDHDTLLITPDLLGLIDVHDLRYVVPYREQQSLITKMELMAGGTIAISGPRGVGKSTLLRTQAQRWAAGHLVVPVQIPAAYIPQEFLLSLFQQVCERFIERHGRAADSSSLFLVKPRKHVLIRLRGVAPFWARLLVGMVLLSVALAPVARALHRALKGDVQEWLTRSWDDASGFAVRLWEHHLWLTRMPLVLLGLGVLASLPRWQRRSPLLKECINYLYLLRTAQSTSLATSAAVTPFAAGTAGAGRTTTLSSRTLNFPELVVHFRHLLERMAEWGRAEDGNHGNDRRIFIIIDEIDRIGTAEQARSLLAEVKAVFGIPNVYFLISVAEDVGAEFVRRGLPDRDVFDSSLDDVIHLKPRTLSESQVVLQNRVPGLTAPFIALAHCLSGGITRDLIRYTRQLVAIPDRRGLGEGRLTEVARELLLDEFQETLSGFRTLLSRTESLIDWAPNLDDARLALLLPQERSENDRASLARDAIQRLIEATTAPTETTTASQTDGGRQHRDELGAYGDFVLTLLDFFAGKEPFPSHEEFKNAGTDGDLQRLADARLELAVSPTSTRLVLKRFREAWRAARARTEAAS
ncbi:P-loop NTPase fold protein [Streptomyces sp. ME19-01-6]|uniref:P-loop NTPase fold protein n=1 Tax=Streptomyces sp. ME19-01-6 TaxID=3028686 RepID=UPI0029B33AB8|nr:P-loop NTPase fold protein [Streptomyces sp. ME19-01-6]MDX3231216.1 P-loop NTPase fold protein [Streptomyces sp. ME19-01-6]